VVCCIKNGYKLFWTVGEVEMNQKKLVVQEQEINIIKDDYISLTDIARSKNADEPKDLVKNWLRSKNTIAFLGLWEKINNPDFKGVEFDSFLNEAGFNRR
jgi:hypothetical protein